MKKILYKKIQSPIGDLYIVSNTKALVILAMKENWDKLKSNYPSMIESDDLILTQTSLQLNEYFSKKRKLFDIPLFFEGTYFQCKTWNALLQIPYGTTISYAKQAENIDNPKAVRAIGRTNGLNPISIIIPCHRVIGKSGKLTGYAGGLHVKEFLLDLEASHS